MENKVVLITGCGRGIGIELAKQLTQTGAKVELLLTFSVICNLNNH
jgi:NAD(P)-dependent dehydrogenase (short-subunit alcohol dehydrogenase family)